MKQSHPWSLPSLYKKAAPLLRPLGAQYARLMRRRRERYAEGGAFSFRTSCPCVSVGNIAFGGTGKTPLVARLLAWTREEGLRAVVLSRGYKGKPGAEPLLVSSSTSAERSGDEPLMLARDFPDVPVIVFPRRAESARLAERLFTPDILILDDGMQHLAVTRDADIVLLRPEDLDEDWNRVIPSGPWREGEYALTAASAFAVKAEPDAFMRLAPLAEWRLARFGKPLFSFSLEATGLERLVSARGKEGPLAVNGQEYTGKPYILLSGVGNPAGVETTAARLMGGPPVRHFDFGDHHRFDAADIRAVIRQAPASLPVLFTAKDAVKLRPLAEAFNPHPALTIRVEAVFGPALFTSRDFMSWWRECWQGMRDAHCKGRTHG